MTTHLTISIIEITDDGYYKVIEPNILVVTNDVPFRSLLSELPPGYSYMAEKINLQEEVFAIDFSEPLPSLFSDKPKTKPQKDRTQNNTGQPKPKRGYKHWTLDEDNDLKALWKDNVRMNDLCELFARTRAAVMTRLRLFELLPHVTGQPGSDKIYNFNQAEALEGRAQLRNA